MRKITMHLASEPGIYFQVFLFNICIVLLQLTGAHLSGSASEQADAFHILADQVVFFLMIVVGVLVYNFKEQERVIRSVGGLLGALLFFFVSYDILVDSYTRYQSGLHSVLGQYMLVFTLLAFGLNWLQHKLLVMAESRDTLTSFDLQGHVKIDLYKNAGLVIIALINIFITLPHLDIILSVLIGVWLFYRGMIVLRRSYMLFTSKILLLA